MNNDSKIYFDRGTNKVANNDYVGAIGDFTKAIEFDSQNVEAYIKRGRTKSRLQDHIGAIQDYTKAIELEPNNIVPYHYRGNSKLAIGDELGAKDDYNKAEQIQPGNILSGMANFATSSFLDEDFDTVFDRGDEKYGQGDYEGAIEDFSKAIELDPENALAYAARGTAKQALNDFFGAMEDANKCIALGGI